MLPVAFYFCKMNSNSVEKKKKPEAIYDLDLTGKSIYQNVYIDIHSVIVW